ncbi:MAG TPA: DUF4097 family beta strand repeat-containing protein [Rhodanobacteraceae bacterium]|nr:DUF4097 family beta strand repeat-containing protein [Rhodanobacteraceae bacterium]
MKPVRLPSLVQITFATAVLFGVATSTHADTPLHLSHDATPDAQVVIRNVKGDVRVTGWNENRVQVEGSLGSGAKPLQITGMPSSLVIQVESNGGSSWFKLGGSDNVGPTSLDVRVPHAAVLQVHVVSAPVDIDGMDSRDISVNTVSGRVHLGVHAGSVKIDSVSGDVDLAGTTRSFDAQTVSGDVQAATLGGNANAQTVSGAVLLRGSALDNVNLETVSGRIQLDAAAANDAAWKINTMSGDVRVGLPVDTVARIKADTFSGDLHSDFGKPVTSEHGPGSHLDTGVGKGGGNIAVNSFSGDVHIQGAAH